MTSDALPDLERVLKALADTTRLRILALLRAGEVCVCHIHESLKLPQSKVSRHLAYLRQAGLVRARRDGLWVHYGLATWRDPAVQQVIDAAVHAVTHQRLSNADLRRLATRVDVAVSPDPAPTFACCVSTGRSPAAS